MLPHRGLNWWEEKKRRVQNERDEAERLWKKKEAEKLAKIKRKETRHIRKKMGVFRYYLCPCLRYMFDDTVEKLTKEEREERDRLIALARRKADLEAKNPSTIPWRKFQKQLEKTPEVIGENLKKTEREREDRKNDRKKRQGRRQRSDLLDNDLPETF